jgi:predicted nucleic acid-binding protein
VNLLDTDALSHLQKGDAVGATIAANMASFPDHDFRITIVNAYEMLAGAFDLIHQLRKKHKDLIPGFQLFQELVDDLGAWQGRILPYDNAADRVDRGFPPRLRQDIDNDARIAAIALAHGAGVWTCNVDDEKRVPGLIVYAAETGIRVP